MNECCRKCSIQVTDDGVLVPCEHCKCHSSPQQRKTRAALKKLTNLSEEYGLYDTPQQEGEMSELDHAFMTLFAIHKTAETDRAIEERFTSVLKTFQSRILSQATKRIEEKVEGMKKYHKVFECNGAHGGKGCYESWCDMETCTSKEAIELKVFNSALDRVLNLLREE